MVIPINPFSGYLAQGAQLDRLQAADKTRQAKRANALSKNIAARDDEMEHQVESTEQISPVNDQGAGQQHGGQTGKKKNGQTEDPKDAPPHLDITG